MLPSYPQRSRIKIGSTAIEEIESAMQEVVQVEVLKLLQVGIIDPISGSYWVSSTQVVPNKSGVTTVLSKKREEMPTRLTTG